MSDLDDTEFDSGVDPEHFDGDPNPRRLGFDGYAAAVDPRESFDDLVERKTEDVHEPVSYGEHATMEAYRSGWVATAIVLDDADRILLVRHVDADHWAAPGGTLQPGETLAAGLIREVEEETGVAVDPTRPHAIADVRSRLDGGEANEWTGFRVVTFGARATGDTRPTPDAGGDSEAEIADAAWFESLPENTFHRELTARILERVRAT